MVVTDAQYYSRMWDLAMENVPIRDLKTQVEGARSLDIESFGWYVRFDGTEKARRFAVALFQVGISEQNRSVKIVTSNAAGHSVFLSPSEVTKVATLFKGIKAQNDTVHEAKFSTHLEAQELAAAASQTNISDGSGNTRCAPMQE